MLSKRHAQRLFGICMSAQLKEAGFGDVIERYKKIVYVPLRDCRLLNWRRLTHSESQ